MSANFLVLLNERRSPVRRIPESGIGVFVRGSWRILAPEPWYCSFNNTEINVENLMFLGNNENNE
jgi:hypothetical protein